MTDYYEVLGVSRTANSAEIKRAYRKLAAEHHPDKHGGAASADEKFKQVNVAHDCLSNPEKRALYDEFGLDGLRENFDPGAVRRARHGTGGSAWPGWTPPVSPSRSRGAGGGYKPRTDWSDFKPGKRKGKNLEGRATIDLGTALRGGSIPFHTSDKNITLEIPAGIQDGTKLRVAGYGAAGSNGGDPGDLYLTILIRPHEFFRRDPSGTLHLTLPVTLSEAYRGVKVVVPTPTGPVSLSIPPGARDGLLLRLKQRGAPTPGRSHSHGHESGDLYVEVKVLLPDTPERRSEDLDNAYEVLEKLYAKNVREDLKL